MSDKKRKLVAYHEAGHALVGALMPEYDPVTKISIVPRGAAGGLTFFAPSEERLESGLYSKTYFENQVRVVSQPAQLALLVQMGGSVRGGAA
jgi:cell division protease FtsH